MNRFRDWKYPKVEEGKLTEYNWIVQHKDKLEMGYGVDIGAFTYINAKNQVTIEDHVQIGSHCSIYTVSTIDGKKGPVILRRRSKIGTHSVIMPGVIVGENSTVGAFSFVTKSIPPNVTVVGKPAKIIRRRKTIRRN